MTCGDNNNYNTNDPDSSIDFLSEKTPPHRMDKSRTLNVRKGHYYQLNLARDVNPTRARAHTRGRGYGRGNYTL